MNCCGQTALYLTVLAGRWREVKDKDLMQRAQRKKGDWRSRADDDQICCADERLNAREAGLGSDQIKSRLSDPESCELSVGEEDVRGARRVRAVLKILYAAVQEQSGAIGVEVDRRGRVIVALRNQSAVG